MWFRSCPAPTEVRKSAGAVRRTMRPAVHPHRSGERTAPADRIWKVIVETTTTLEEKRRAAWYAELLLRALPLAETLEEAVAAVEVALSHNPEPDAEVSAMFGWVATNTTNRDGLPGWKNQETGEYRYQKTWPGTHRWAAPDTPAGIRTPATPEATGGGRPAAAAPPGGGPRPPAAPKPPATPGQGAHEATHVRGPRTPKPPKASAQAGAAGSAPGAVQPAPAAPATPSTIAHEAKHHREPKPPETPAEAPAEAPAESATPAQQQPAAAPPQAPASGVAPPTERSPTHEAAHQDVFEGFVNSVEMNHLPEETAEKYARAGLQVFDRMSEGALNRFKAGHAVVIMAPDYEGMHVAVANESEGMRSLIEKGGRVAGLYSIRQGKGRLILDGDSKKFKAHEAYAHEFMHAVDGPRLEISRSREWQEAWSEEIKGKGISKYAWGNAQEGLAEMGRLLWTHDDPESALANYPKAAAVLRKFGVI